MSPETNPSTPSNQALEQQTGELDREQLDQVDGGATVKTPAPPAPVPPPLPYPNLA